MYFKDNKQVKCKAGSVLMNYAQKPILHLNEFNPFPNKSCFLHVCIAILLKTLWEMEKLLVTRNFPFSLCVFNSFVELSAIFIKFAKCHLQTLSVWKGIKFVVWERVTNYQIRSLKDYSMHFYNYK